MRLLRTIMILLLVPGVLQELRADVNAERLAEIPSAMEAAIASGHAAGGSQANLGGISAIHVDNEFVSRKALAAVR